MSISSALNGLGMNPAAPSASAVDNWPLKEYPLETTILSSRFTNSSSLLLLLSAGVGSFFQKDQQPPASQHHGHAQHLAHGKGEEHESQLGVGLPGIFDEKACDPVAHEVEGQHGATGFDAPLDAPQDDKKDDALEKGLIELRGVASSRPGRQGEEHADGMGGHPSVELTIDEITQPAEGIAQRNAGDDQIGHVEKRQLVLAYENERRDHHADQSAMVGHARYSREMEPAGELKRQDDFQRVLQVV
ncbi:hypothetical protein DESC_830097 [Desulfosarcina cetonica]|nr:hypothetical protein DESC_830097 [Desulfosarcina cetonica]